MNIILTGYMASGKSTIGKYLAQKLKMKFIDTDEYIEKQQDKQIKDIFSENGEAFFRKLENECARALYAEDNTVISTGGGFVLNPQNTELLRKNGVIVNIETNEAVIRDRLEASKSSRPLMNGSSIEEILKRFDKRKSFYDNCDIKIKLTVTGNTEDYAAEIEEKIKQLKG